LAGAGVNQAADRQLAIAVLDHYQNNFVNKIILYFSILLDLLFIFKNSRKSTLETEKCESVTQTRLKDTKLFSHEFSFNIRNIEKSINHTF
jgi:hypothetical protein